MPAAPIPAPDRLLHERALWSQGLRPIAGVDEAGRGPLAGPVVVAAVILPRTWERDGVPEAFRDLNDSKQLTGRQRDTFFDRIREEDGLLHAIVTVSHQDIDRLNILAATHLGMNQALAGLPCNPVHVLVDGTRVPSLRWPQTPLVKGDSLSYSIAAASVLAKVTRDRFMTEADQAFPGYGFARHKGYPTPDHLKALERLGPCPIHRLSFAPLRQDQLDLFR